MGYWDDDFSDDGIFGDFDFNNDGNLGTLEKAVTLDYYSQVWDDEDRRPSDSSDYTLSNSSYVTNSNSYGRSNNSYGTSNSNRKNNSENKKTKKIEKEYDLYIYGEGEDVKSRRENIAKEAMKTRNLIEKIKEMRVYIYCGVIYPQDDEETHYYKANNEDIKIGEIVRVKVNDELIDAIVVSIGKFTKLSAPTPPKGTKYILE